jgi:hypothetical protein
MHVFVEPAVFAKYPPGHALMLVPGIWLGAPGVMPALLAGIAGALTFWLARWLSNVWVAALTWLLWTSAPVTLIWATSYLSESTSTVMWLAAGCATLLWLDTGKQRYLVYVAASLAWGFAARPLTMVALTVPLAFVIMQKVVETGRWRALAVPMLVGIVILGLSPLWNQQTLGDSQLDPYAHYSRTYFPFDKPGVGLDSTPPLRPVPAELSAMDAWSRSVHELYVPAAIPSAFVARIVALLASCATGWRLAIAALLVGGLIRPRGAARVCVAATISLLAAYLVFAHPPGWVVYYFELLPALHFLAAASLVRLVGQLKRTAESTDRVSPFAARASLVAAFLLLPLCIGDLAKVRLAINQRNEFHRQAADAIRSAPPKSILFVRYPASYNPHLGITRNEADLASARSWVVYDRGGENARLLSMARDRTAYLLDVATWSLQPLISAQDSVSHASWKERD